MDDVSLSQHKRMNIKNSVYSLLSVVVSAILIYKEIEAPKQTELLVSILD
jgi:hypothetical protein